MENWKPGDSDSPVRPSTDGQGVWYHLPHLPSESEEERDKLVLAIDEAEDHISKLKFILFLRDIRAQWPKGVAAMGVQYDSSVSDAPIWRIRCWKKTRKPAAPDSFPGTPSVPANPVVPGMEPVPTPTQFSRFITHHGVQDEEGFPLLASLHLGGEPAPWTKDQFAALEMDVLEPATRSRLLAARADKALPPASASRTPGPGRL